MLKSQCAWHLAKMVNSGQVYEDADTTTRELLEEELEQIKQKNIDKDGKRSLQSKDLQKMVLGRSPDDADTYIMRAWFDLAIIEGYSIVSTTEKKTNKRRI
jgi:phage terminase large subunit